MTTLISTPNSSLDFWIFDDKELLDRCVEEIKEKLSERPSIIVYGRECRQNRDVGFFSDDSIGYKYSRQIMESKPLTENLKKLLENVNSRLGSGFNGILVNRYNNGEQYIGKHSDDESGLDDKGVVGISYGAVRKFRIRDKKEGKIVKDIPLEHMSVVHMKGSFQKEFTHEIPVEKKVKGERISFTFRKHLE